MEGGQYNVDISFERTIEYDQCPVCLCELSDNISIFTLPCVHTICENCIGKMNDECPLCRTTIENNIVNLELERGQSAVTKKPEKQSNMEVCELERTSSVNTLLRCVSSSISNTVENNVKYNEIGTKKPQYIQKTVHHLHKFDKLRFEFNNKQDPSKFPYKIINKENIGSTQIYSKSPLLLNVVTCRSIDYNDLVVKTFLHQENNNLCVSYIKLSVSNTYMNLEHSGDKLNKQEQMLYHNILIKTNEDYVFTIIPMDMPCENLDKTIDSTSSNNPQQEEFNIIYEKSKTILSQENLVETVICSQITYKKNKTLRELCIKNKSSTAILITKDDNTKEINMCEWENDTCNMCTWAIIGVYKIT